ncbi:MULTISPECIES: DUF748 domain-containing protein [Marinomonas]|uniref:DUF748 domain-containing protein n=1 Tax=Marinomonas arctica TaxID=383750 RepID=A0A7H1J2T5_9GAMM|nr:MULTISPECIES: DUF748 domain-containing protein [Marinomonas]MCS7486511.1 hypothetical protein [Marinomonas sp. BSi20414]QNT04801.1 DUF748 domain-containing protein [Marinomonas arctica]
MMMTRRHFRHFIFYPFAGVTALITSLWLATPFVAEHYLTSYIQQQGQTLSIGKLKVDFFPPKIDIKDVVIQDNTQDTLTLKRAIVEVEIWPLFTKTVHLSEAKIEDLHLVVTQLEKDWIVAGINTAQFITPEDQQPPEQESEPATPWTITLPSFSFTNSQVNLSRQPDLNLPATSDTFILKNLSVNDLSGQGLSWKGDVSLSALLNEATMSLDSQFDYSPEQATADIDITKVYLPIQSLRHFLPSPYHEGKGQLDLTGRFQFAQTQANGAPVFDIKNLTINTQIDELEFPLNAQDKVTTKSTSLALSQSAFQFSSADKVMAAGAINLQSTQSSFTQAEQKIAFERLALETPFNLERGESGLSATGNVAVQLKELAFTQGEVMAQLATLSLKTPYDVKQDTAGLATKGHVEAQLEQLSYSQSDQKVQFDTLSLNTPFSLQQGELGLATTGTLDTQIEGFAFTQDDLQAQLDAMKLTTPFDVKQDELSLTAIGDFTLTLNSVFLTQAEQKVQFDQLTLNAPFNVKQDEQLGLTANLDSTQVNLDILAVSLDSLALQNKQLAMSLDNVAVNVDTKDILTASLFTEIRSSDLAVQQAGNTANYDVFNLSNTLALQKDGDTVSAKNTQLNINIEGLKATQSNQKLFSLGRATLTAEQLNVEQINQQPPAIKGSNINITSESVDSLLSDTKRLASWRNADITGLTFTQQDKDFDASLAQLNIANLIVSEAISGSNDNRALLPLSQIGNIKIEQANATQDGAKIKQITVDSAKVNLILDAQKRIENLVFVETEQQKPPQTSVKNRTSPREEDAKNVIKNTQQAEQNPAFKAPYYVILDAYDTTGSSSIYVQDNSISPALQRTLEIDTLSLRNLNTQKKDQATVLALKARNGKYTILQGDVTIWPLADKLTLDSEVIIKEAELPPYSSYIATVLGYQIDSGQLDLDLKLKSKNGILSGNSNILLREFDLGGRQDSSTVVKAGAVPFNIAVSVLKDSNNNIDLDIPLSGDIENPAFGWQDFLLLPVRKALFSASSTYLMQTFVPYANVISIAQFAGDQLLRIRVEPLMFTAQDSNLNESQTIFLQQLSALMKDKKDSQLKACGIASYLDLGLQKPPVAIDDDTRDKAKMLAQKRADHLKDYLVNEGIASSRIFLCSPEIDLSNSSKPRVELNF